MTENKIGKPFDPERAKKAQQASVEARKANQELKSVKNDQVLQRLDRIIDLLEEQKKVNDRVHPNLEGKL